MKRRSFLASVAGLFGVALAPKVAADAPVPSGRAIWAKYCPSPTVAFDLAEVGADRTVVWPRPSLTGPGGRLEDHQWIEPGTPEWEAFWGGHQWSDEHLRLMEAQDEVNWRRSLVLNRIATR